MTNMPTSPTHRALPHDLAALIHHVELSRAGWRKDALNHLLLASLKNFPAGASPDHIHATASAGLPSPLISSEVYALLRIMKEDGHIIELANGHLKLAEQTRQELADQLTEAEARTDEVRRHFHNVCVNLPDSIPLSWRTFLNDFLEPLVHELGAKTHYVVTGEAFDIGDTNTSYRFLSRFPTKDRASVFETIARFLDSRSDPVRHYVLGLLNTAFIMHALALPAGTTQKILQRMQRTLQLRVFADTNFLFHLLGLDATTDDDTVHQLHEILRQLPRRIKVKLYMLSCTVTEAIRTLAHYRDTLSYAHRSSKLMNIIRDAPTTLSGIAGTYFRKASTNTNQIISAKAYFGPYIDNFTDIARSKSVELYDSPETDMDQEVIDDLQDQLNFQRRLPDRRQKSYKTLMHDMVLWHFTKRLRRSHIESPLDAEVWLATIDGGLLRFDDYKRKKADNTLPICIHPTVLLQILQFWIPHNKALDTALMNSLRPMQRFDSRAEKTTMDIIGALARFEHIDDVPRDTMAKILVSDLVRGKMEKATDDSETLEILQSEIAEQNRLLADQAEEYKQAAEKMRANAEKMRATAEERRRSLDLITGERDTAQAALDSERAVRRRLEGKLERVAKEQAQAARESATREEARSRTRQALYRGGGTFGAVLVLSLSGVMIAQGTQGLSNAYLFSGIASSMILGVWCGAYILRRHLIRHPRTRNHNWAKTALSVMIWCGGIIGAIVAGVIVTTVTGGNEISGE